MQSPSFFYRLLWAFTLSSLIPLFVLAFVVTGVFELLAQRGAQKRVGEELSAAASIFEGLLNEAKERLISVSTSSEALAFLESTDAVIEANLIQRLSRAEGGAPYRFFVVRDGGGVCAAGSIPEAYVRSAYRHWGIFYEAARVSSFPLIFGFPHREGASAALLMPLTGEGWQRGWVIADIMRDGLSELLKSYTPSLNRLTVRGEDGLIWYSTEGVLEGGFADALPEGHSREGDYSLIGDAPSIMGDFGGIRLASLLLALIAGGISFFMALRFSQSLSRPVRFLVRAMRAAERGDLERGDAEYRAQGEMGFLIRSFYEMTAGIKRLMAEALEREQRLRLSELKNLQARIHPHFLYNTLNSIRAQARLAGDTETAQAIGRLSRLLRYSSLPLDEKVSLRFELDHARSYFEIESFRREGRVSLYEDIERSLLSLSVPRLMIQPLVENALLHGLPVRSREGRIIVSVRRVQGLCLIAVEDGGEGMDEERLCFVRSLLADPQRQAAASFALVNIHRRLVLLYGSRAGLTIESRRGGGTRVVITLPVEQL